MQASIADARSQWRAAGDEELWATYVVLGELLDTGPGKDEAAYEAEYRALVGRLIQLGNEIERRFEQQFVAWLSRIKTSGRDA
jgi:hypothetical protein